MPFRAGEELDAGTLGPYLAGKLPDAEGLPEIWQFGGGNANLTYLLRYASGVEYVLRRPPHGPVAPTSHDMAREHRVLSVLYRAFPPSPPPTLLHNDWRLDNMAVAFDDPSRCVAVYDWDMCTRGDPLADLGTLLSQWIEAGEDQPPVSPMPSREPGFMTRAEAARRYAERSGRDVSRLPWYYVFGMFKIAVIVQQIYVRYHRGQTQDARFAPMGEIAERLIVLASRHAAALG